MSDINAVGLLVGLALELFGVGSGVRLRFGKAVLSMSLGGFLIALSVGLLVL